MLPFALPAYRPAAPRMGQDAAPPAPAPSPAPIVVQTKPAGPGLLETAVVLGVLTAAAYTGVRAGMKEKERLPKYAGWVSGAGSALLGILYLTNRM